MVEGRLKSLAFEGLNYPDLNGVVRRRGTHCRWSFVQLRTERQRQEERSSPNTVLVRSSCWLSSQSPLKVVHPTSFLLRQMTTGGLADLQSPISIATSSYYEPILNLPALVSFLVVAVIFVSIQVRMMMISDAVRDRTKALETVRQVKRQQLAGEISVQEANEAIEVYRNAYEKVEQLRTIIPGIARLLPPPSRPDQIDMNAAAAKQFLGISIDPDEYTNSTVTAARTSKQQQQQQQSPSTAQQKNGLAPVLVIVLVAVALTQIGLLVLLSIDPMSPKSLFESVDTTNYYY